MATATKTKGEYFASRGIGTDWTPGCFVCKTVEKERTLHNNIAAFVESKKSGEDIVDMFGRGAFLDFRPFEPNWVQVKVGACDKHKKNLESLHKLARDAGNRITQKMIEEARAEG